MKSKKTIFLLLAFLIASSLLIANAKANVFPNLPTTPVTLTLTLGITLDDRWPGSVVFEGIADVDPSYDVENNMPYVAWCAQFDSSIHTATPYATVLSSHPDLEDPVLVETAVWNKINWLLNQGYAENQAVQFAIWLLLGTTAGEISARYTGTVNNALLTDAIAMVVDADADGETFVPSAAGQTIAVYCNVIDYYESTEEEAQDLIIELEIPGEYEGLTPGFWKNHYDLWTGYSTDDTFYDIFGVYITINANGKNPGIYDPPLIEAIAAQGGVNEEKGIYDALARHAVAALLNSAHPDVNYPMTEQEIIDAVYDAITNGGAESLKNTLDMYNNAGGGIDAHGYPI